MKIGTPKEIKNNENRVSCISAGTPALYKVGYGMYVEINAGTGGGFLDRGYEGASAQIKMTNEVFALADLIVRVKEYLPQEYHYLHEDQLIFTCLHTANDEAFTNTLLESETTATAYETICDRKDRLPLLIPTSEVAGCMAAQVGVTMLQRNNDGCGLLLGGVPGILPAEVVVIGGGTVGLNAAKIVYSLGVIMTIFDISANHMGYIDGISGGMIHMAYSNEYNPRRALRTADLVIGAALAPSVKAPKIVTEDMVKTMKPGSAVVDVAIGQGGCIEASDHITTHGDPYFEHYGVMYYSVTNMPGMVPRTSTMAPSNATLPYILKLAEEGMNALKEDTGFPAGLDTCRGHIAHQGVNDALQLPYADPMELLQAQKG